MTSLKTLAIRGTIWTVFGYGSIQLIRFLANIILTRLLLPEYFGLMALVNTFTQGLELFSDIGIGQNVVQSKRGDDPVFLDTAWTIQALRGIAIWGACCLLAWPIAQFYGEPKMFYILPVVAICNVLNGLRTTRFHTLNRHVELGKYTVFTLLEYAIAVAAMIALAWIYRSVWALVVGAVISAVFAMIGSYVICPGPNHQFTLEPEARQEIIAFGRWIFISSIVIFLAEQSDRMVLGKLIPLHTLGVYSIAYALSALPQQVIKKISFQVIFPIVSKQADLPRSTLREKIIKQRGKLLIGISLMCIILICFGDKIILFLYDDRYRPAAWMLPLLSSGIWFTMLYATASACLLGLGKPLYDAQSRIVRLLGVTFGLFLGFQIAGIVGAVVVVAFSDIPSYLILQYGLNQEGITFTQQDIKLTLGLTLVIALILGLRFTLGFGHPLEILWTA